MFILTKEDCANEMDGFKDGALLGCKLGSKLGTTGGILLGSKCVAYLLYKWVAWLVLFLVDYKLPLPSKLSFSNLQKFQSSPCFPLPRKSEYLNDILLDVVIFDNSNEFAGIVNEYVWCNIMGQRMCETW